MKKILVGLAALFSLTVAAFSAAVADAVTHSVVGVQGYDLVSYHTGERPLQGNGHHVHTYKGVNYLFINEANKDMFAANPEKYVPAYGGYCAFGAAVNKKFIGDPTVWDIIDGKLYFNLDNKVKGIWVKDIDGNIEKGDRNWKQIKDIPAATLNAM